MKQILFVICVAAMLSGCGRPKSIPAGRVEQPSGKFSYIVPAGWVRAKLPGIDYFIHSTESDSGVCPNVFVDWVKPSTNRAETVSRFQEANHGLYPDYAVVRQAGFTTDSGLAGSKLTASRKNRDAVSLALFHYLISDATRVIAITCTCAESTSQRYEPVFDAIIKSLETESGDGARR